MKNVKCKRHPTNDDCASRKLEEDFFKDYDAASWIDTITKDGWIKKLLGKDLTWDEKDRTVNATYREARNAQCLLYDLGWTCREEGNPENICEHFIKSYKWHFKWWRCKHDESYIKKIRESALKGGERWTARLSANTREVVVDMCIAQGVRTTECDRKDMEYFGEGGRHPDTFAD